MAAAGVSYPFMTQTRSILAVVALAALALAGCSTVDSRIKEKSSTFQSLDAQAQEKLRQSIIESGNPPDMVYIALGKPDEMIERTTAAGKEEVWVYQTYTQEWAGQSHAYYARRMRFEPRSRRYYMFWEPVYADYYNEHVEDRLRVTFKDGKVTVIEQVKK